MSHAKYALWEKDPGMGGAFDSREKIICYFSNLESVFNFFTDEEICVDHQNKKTNFEVFIKILLI
jgi:hypothetical protein